MRHIARDGETEYAVIYRRRSGQDAGEIEYGLNIAAIHSLSDDDRKELVETAEQMAKALKVRCTMPTVEGLLDSPEWDRLWALCRSGPEHFVVLTMDMPIGVQVIGEAKTAVGACLKALENKRSHAIPNNHASR